MECTRLSSSALALVLALAPPPGVFGQSQPQRAQSANSNAPQAQNPGDQFQANNAPQAQNPGNQSANANAAQRPNGANPTVNNATTQRAAWLSNPGTDLGWRYNVPLNDLSQRLVFGWVDQASQNSGMTLAPADAALRAHLKLSDDQGLIVTAVEAGCPAVAVGIQQNDVLTRVANDPVLSYPLAKPEDLEAALKAFGEQPITIDLLRGGHKMVIKIQPRIHASLGTVRPEPLAYWIGVTVSPVEPALRAQLQLPEKQGLIVTDVDKSGPAAKAGVRQFDILKRFDGVELTDQAGLTKLVQSRAEKTVALEVLREGKPQEIKIAPERRQTSKAPVNLGDAVTGALNYNLWVADGATNTLQWIPRIDPYSGGAWDLVYSNNGTAFPNQPLLLNNKADLNPELAKKLDDLATQVKELRQAIEALAKSQANK
jgi:hypothetical protein